LNALHQSPEHEFEAAPGLPESLPAGERILWQGSPGTWSIARDVLRLRWIAGYFGVLLAWQAASSLHDGAGASQVLGALAFTLTLALVACGLIAAFAWLVSRTSVYTVTDRRVVLRIGVVLNVTFNLPFGRIDAAAVRSRPDGSGDLSLLLTDPDRIAWVHLWPHARPWRLKRTEPTLRGIAQVQQVARVMVDALATHRDRAAAGETMATAAAATSATMTPAPRPIPVARHHQPQPV
jgi:hypothetical protein